MAEDWHQTPSDILEKVSVTDLRHWRMLRIARYEAEEEREKKRQNGHAPDSNPPLELDEADLIDGMYLPDAEEGA